MYIYICLFIFVSIPYLYRFSEYSLYVLCVRSPCVLSVYVYIYIYVSIPFVMFSMFCSCVPGSSVGSLCVGAILGFLNDHRVPRDSIDQATE